MKETRILTEGMCSILVFFSAGLVPFVSGINAINSSLMPSILNCGRVDSQYVECKFKSAGFLFAEETKISPLISASYQVIKGDSDTGDRHLFILSTLPGAIEIETEFQGSEISEEVNKINSFITNSNQSTLIIYPNSVWQYFKRFCFFVIGLLFSCVGGIFMLGLLSPSPSPAKLDKLLEEKCRLLETQTDSILVKSQEEALNLAISLCKRVQDGTLKHEQLKMRSVGDRTVVEWNYAREDLCWGYVESLWIPIGMNSPPSTKMNGCVMNVDAAIIFIRFCQQFKI
jgi:hypothetical protein